MDKFIIGAYVVATAGGLVLLKLGTSNTGLFSLIDGKMIFNINLLTVLGVLLYGISFIIYITLISRFSLGYIVPLTTALVYILVFFASFAVFKEPFSLMKIVAIVFIIGGVILLNAESSQNTNKSNTPSTLKVDRNEKNNS